MTTEKDNLEYETIDEALQDNGIMLLMANVSDESIKPIIEWILHQNYVRKKKLKELLLMICSEGGDLASAFALIDVMRSSRIPIKTVGLGTIASAGLMIFLAGARGRRVLTPNTSIMSHQFHSGTAGKYHDLFATVKEFELTHQRMIDLYRECTGLDDKKIAEILLPPQDVWLSANEALRYKICDHVSQLN